jgi:hypothetical protein
VLEFRLVYCITKLASGATVSALRLTVTRSGRLSKLQSEFPIASVRSSGVWNFHKGLQPACRKHPQNAFAERPQAF